MPDIFFSLVEASGFVVYIAKQLKVELPLVVTCTFSSEVGGKHVNTKCEGSNNTRCLYCNLEIILLRLISRTCQSSSTASFRTNDYENYYLVINAYCTKAKFPGSVGHSPYLAMAQLATLTYSLCIAIC